MHEDFDRIWERKGTSCVKHDMMERDFGRNDLLPMWVADMDFAVPDCILDDLRRRLEHSILGYSTDALNASVRTKKPQKKK